MTVTGAAPETERAADSGSFDREAAPARSNDGLRGRTRISSRALDRVASAVSATALGVEPRAVRVALSDDHGQLVLTVRSPMRVVALERVSRDKSAIDRSGGTILDRSVRAQEQIRAQLNHMTGHRVARVVVRITGVEIRQEDRVK